MSYKISIMWLVREGYWIPEERETNFVKWDSAWRHGNVRVVGCLDMNEHCVGCSAGHLGERERDQSGRKQSRDGSPWWVNYMLCKEIWNLFQNIEHSIKNRKEFSDCKFWIYALFIYSFIQSIYFELLLCTKQSTKLWVYGI